MAKHGPQLIARKQQAGFTIVELMIATLVFSTVVLVITFGIMQFSRAYYRGVTTSTLQNTTRNAIDIVSQAVQFGGSDVKSWNQKNAKDQVTAGGYCIGTMQFQYVIGSQRGGDTLEAGQIDHALISMPPASGGNCAFVDTNSGADIRDLVDPNMRVVKFEIVRLGATSTYKVNLRLAYGDADLLCSPSITNDSVSGSCNKNSDPTDYDYLYNGDLTCKVTTGSQFCAVSELSTIVQKRVQ